MFNRRQIAAFALLACYALPAFAGRGLHGVERCACIPRGMLAVVAGAHAACAHDHAPGEDHRHGDGLKHAEPPHGSASAESCELCFYMAQAQCALDPAAELPRSEPLSAVQIAWYGLVAAPVVGVYAPRGPPLLLA